MKVKNNPLDFELLGSDILEMCPQGKSKVFVDAYLEFTLIFFEELHIHRKIFQSLREGTCEIEFKYILDEAYRISKVNGINSSEYLEGLLLAEFNILEGLIFTYKWDPKSRAA